MGAVVTLAIGANSYSVYAIATDALADAKEYFGGRLGTTAWDDADSNDQKKSIVNAARMLDRGVTWSGEKTVSSQPREWPRDNATCDGEAVTDGTTPDDIARGQFELALALLEDESIQDSPSTGSNIKSAGAGTAKVEFFKPTIDSSNQTRFPTVVHELVGCFQESSSLGAPFSSGVDGSQTDQSSSFCSDSNSYDLNKGYP
jgi:hypothetical protein